MFGSDGSQPEGADAEAARYVVARNHNVKLLVDDNDVRIVGHPSEYMKGFDIEKPYYSVKFSCCDYEPLAPKKRPSPSFISADFGNITYGNKSADQKSVLCQTRVYHKLRVLPGFVNSQFIMLNVPTLSPAQKKE